MHRARAARRSQPALSACLLLAAACARSPNAPAAAGEPCRTQDDCNVSDAGEVRTCGELRLCVSGRCEASNDAGMFGSRIVACTADSGTAPALRGGASSAGTSR
jgi:hypothetical protein